MDNYGFLSLIPPLIAIILAIRTKQVFISLLTGIFFGWLIIGNWNPFIGIILTIENIVNDDGDPTGIYESVKIKNHERLRTTNLNNYIYFHKVH